MLDEFLENSEEKTLLADLERLRRTEARLGYYACHIALDKTQFLSQNRDSFDALATAVARFVFDNQGKTYKLHNFDVALLVKIDNPKVMERMMARLVATLQPMGSQLGLLSQNIDSLITWFDLEADLDAFVARAQKVSSAFDALMNRRNRLLKKATKAGGSDSELGSFDPTTLAEIERALSRANIDSFIRNQPVCAVKAGQAPVPIFREVFVSLDQVRRQFAPSVDLAGTPALFHHLARTLDQRLLRAIIGGYIGNNFGPFSVNLTVQTILSPLFREFDDRVNQVAARNNLVIEIQRYDVFWDYTEFKIACEFLRSNGYRILLDGITPNVLKLFAAMDVGADFIKMVVKPDELDDWAAPEFQKLIQDNAGLIVLARCGNEQEGRIGIEAGIEMFQGWAVDEALRNKQVPAFAA